MKIDILYEDQDILVANKPAGLSTQASFDKKKINLYSLLQNQRNEKLFLHHRLDKDTSGVILLGRSTRANKGLTEIFREKKANKTYWALTQKKPNFQTEITSDTTEWIIRDHLAPTRANTKSMRMVRVKSGGWYAETHFKKIKEYSDYLWIEACPQTGRTHQIRVHLAFEGRPILGDFLYGGLTNEFGHKKIPRLMLHAYELSFPHPITHAIMKIQAPAPLDFINWIQ